MQWEAVTALSAIVTALIILVTAIVELGLIEADAEQRVRAYYERNPKARPSSGEPFTIEALVSQVEASRPEA